MAGKEDNRVFVGGLSWNTTERDLLDAFGPYGKIHACMVMVDRDTGRPRGFGFIDFEDDRDMKAAIRGMHERELDGRVITVNKAKPKPGGDDGHYGRDRDSSRAGWDRSTGGDECFKCGRAGHWARDCPSAGGARVSSRSGLGGGGGYGDRYGDDRYSDRYDSRDGGRYGTRDRDRFSGDRYLDRNPRNGYGNDRDRDRRGGFDRDERGGGGPARYDRGGHRDRPSPYDRPRR